MMNQLNSAGNHSHFARLLLKQLIQVHSACPYTLVHSHFYIPLHVLGFKFIIMQILDVQRPP